MSLKNLTLVAFAISFSFATQDVAAMDSGKKDLRSNSAAVLQELPDTVLPPKQKGNPFAHFSDDLIEELAQPKQSTRTHTRFTDASPVTTIEQVVLDQDILDILEAGRARFANNDNTNRGTNYLDFQEHDSDDDSSSYGSEYSSEGYLSDTSTQGSNEKVTTPRTSPSPTGTPGEEIISGTAPVIHDPSSFITPEKQSAPDNTSTIGNNSGTTPNDATSDVSYFSKAVTWVDGHRLETGIAVVAVGVGCFVVYDLCIKDKKASVLRKWFCRKEAVQKLAPKN